MNEDEMIARTRAVNAIARKLYDRNVARSEPGFDDAPEIMRHGFLEMADGMTNMVLSHLSPASPDYQGLLIHLELLQDELRHTRSLTGVKAAAMIESAITNATTFGVAKGGA